MKLCECGCGREVTTGRRFIWGHNRRGIPHTPYQIAANQARTGVPHTSPAQIAADEARRGVPKPPETCVAMSTAQLGVPKTSPAQIAAIEVQRGGNDLVNHHYIYDESDLSLNAIQMTRKDHTSLHRLLKKLGYIIPHINIKGTEMDNQKV